MARGTRAPGRPGKPPRQASTRQSRSGGGRRGFESDAVAPAVAPPSATLEEPDDDDEDLDADTPDADHEDEDEDEDDQEDAAALSNVTVPGDAAEPATEPLPPGLPPENADTILTETRLLPVRMNPDELRRAADDLVHALDELDKAEANKVSVVFAARAAIKEAKAVVNTRTAQLRTRTKESPVTCESLLDLERRMVIVVRTDRTRDDDDWIVERRSAQDNELQYPLPIAPAAAAPEDGQEPRPIKCGHCGGDHPSDNCSAGLPPPGNPEPQAEPGGPLYE